MQTPTALSILPERNRVSAGSAAVHGEMRRLPSPIAQGILPDSLFQLAALLQRSEVSTGYGRN